MNTEVNTFPKRTAQLVTYVTPTLKRQLQQAQQGSKYPTVSLYLAGLIERHLARVEKEGA